MSFEAENLLKVSKLCEFIPDHPIRISPGVPPCLIVCPHDPLKFQVVCAVEAGRIVFAKNHEKDAFISNKPFCHKGISIVCI